MVTNAEAKIIEEVVNSQEAVQIVEEKSPYLVWPRLRGLVQVKIGRLLRADEDDALYRDLNDWWKNGNFFVGAGYEFGDPDFWKEN